MCAYTCRSGRRERCPPATCDTPAPAAAGRAAAGPTSGAGGGIRIEPPPSLACAIGTAGCHQGARSMRRRPLWSVFHGYGRSQPRCSATALKPGRQLHVLPGHQPGAAHRRLSRAVGDGRVWYPRVGAMHRRLSGSVDVVLDEGRHSTEERLARPIAAASRAVRKPHIASTFSAGLTASARAMAASSARPTRLIGWRRRGRPRRGHQGHHQQRCARHTRLSLAHLKLDEPCAVTAGHVEQG